PRADREDTRALYCASMLMLLKPWRTMSDLKGEGGSWEQAYQEYLVHAPQRCKDIIANIQYFYECKN
ncbi:hypothetical protein CALVIDRAFT_468509, partial [Calocera viscosa TUFC12733]